MASACGDSSSSPGGAGGTSTSTSTGGTGGTSTSAGTGGTGGVGGAAPEPADALFAGTSIPRIDITLSEAAITALNAAPYSYVAGDVKIEIDGQVHVLSNVGLHIKGKYGSFRMLDQKASFLLNLDKYKHQHFGLEKLALNNMVQDASMIHERIGYRLFHAMGVAAARSAWANVYVNETLYGLYATVEPPDNTAFLQTWFGSDKGNLYEGAYGAELVVGGQTAFDQDHGENIAFADLLELAQTLDAMALTDPATWFAELGTVIDMDAYVRFAATEMYLGHWDGYANGINNYFLYRRPSDSRWVFMPWGIDQILQDSLDLWASGGRIQGMCLKSQPCRNAMAAAFTNAIEQTLAVDLAGQAAGLKAFLWESIVADPRKEVDHASVSATIDVAVAFLQNRPSDVNAQLVCTDPNTVDADHDGASGCGVDCNDQNPTVYPGAPELCNLTDEDCDGIWDNNGSCPSCMMQPSTTGGTLAFCFVPRTWADAETDCVTQGGHLASVHSQAEHDTLAASAYAIAGGDWWLGLTDEAQEGLFVWTDGTPLDFTAWAGGQPDNAAGQEHCGHMAEWAGAAWNDNTCLVSAQYICALP